MVKLEKAEIQTFQLSSILHTFAAYVWAEENKKFLLNIYIIRQQNQQSWKVKFVLGLQTINWDLTCKIMNIIFLFHFFCFSSSSLRFFYLFCVHVGYDCLCVCMYVWQCMYS